MTDPIIRRARSDDAKLIAAFHLRIWRATYDGIAPAEAFSVLDLPHRERQWQQILAGTDSGNSVWIAEHDGAIVGLAACRPPSTAVFQPRGEITYLYVDPACRGRGLGRRLLTIATDFLHEAGFLGVALAVVRQNRAARDFYRRMDGVETQEFIDPGPVWRSEDVLVVWDQDPISRSGDQSDRQ